MTQQSKSTYTIADLQAMPDTDLNALAAELRKLESVRTRNLERTTTNATTRTP